MQGQASHRRARQSILAISSRRKSLTPLFTIGLLLLLLGMGLSRTAASPSAFEYYILNPRIQTGPLQVMSLSDGNRIRMDGVEILLDRYARETISAGAGMAPGSRITGTGPFTVASEVQGTDLPAPGIFAGTEFVIPHARDHHVYHLLSPHGEARVEIRLGSVTQIQILPQGEMVIFDAGDDNSRAGRLRSDRPILVEHAAYNGTHPRDVYPVPPAARNLWGIRSNSAVVAAMEDATTVAVYASNGDSGQFTLDAGEKRAISIGVTGSQGMGSALYIVADKPVAAIQLADGDGVEATAFLDKPYLGTRYGIAVDSQYLAVACPYQDTVINLYHGTAHLQELSCFDTGAASYPGKAYFGSAINGSHIPAGAHLESSQPIYLYQEAHLPDAERNLLGHQDRYFILEDRTHKAPLSVISLVDDNRIRAGDYSLLLNRYQQGTIPAGDDLLPGSEITGTGPFTLGSELAGTDLPVPGIFAGTEFVIPHFRNRQVYGLLSPYGDARADIRIGADTETIELPFGQLVEFEAGEDKTLAGMVSASRPILLLHTAFNALPRDVYPVPPASRELWGIRTGAAVVGALQDNTLIQVYASNGASGSFTLHAGQKRSISIGASGQQGTGNALHIVANKPVAAIQIGDGDWTEATAFLGEPYLGMRFAFPVDTQYVAVACPEPDTRLSLLHGVPPTVVEQPCSGEGAFPGKAYFGSASNGVHIRAGAIMESNRPIYLMYEAAASNGERNLLGAMGSLAQRPWVVITAPTEGEFTNQPRPLVQIGFGPLDGVLDTDSLELYADDQPLAIRCVFDAAVADCVPDASLPEGEIRLMAAITDMSGQRIESEPVAFTLDRTPPVIQVDNPSAGSWVNTALLQVTGQITETVELFINGAPVALDVQHRFTHPIDLAEGFNGVWLLAFDRAGNLGWLYNPVHLDTVPPLPPSGDRIQVSEPSSSQISVIGEAGAVEVDSHVQVTNLDTGESVTVDATPEGGFSITLIARPGDRLDIRVTDRAGNVSESWITLVAGGVDEPLPPDPATLAPPLDPTVATSLYAATVFLYSGPNPIQLGVAPGTIEERRVAVIRGQVKTQGGTALPGATITIKDHEEYGHTSSRADGLFDLAVNGGGWLTVRYEREGYLPVQRQIKAPWQDYVWLPDVVMIGLDSRVTTVDLASTAAIQTARGNRVTDADGTRQATILFPQGTQAELLMPDGSTQSHTSLGVRATEYTVGTNGPAAMPGELPPTSGYTYAVELSVDEAIAAGATEIRFDRPLPFYLENFLEFPVGGIVPAGWYDRDRAAWIPSENGRIIRVLSVSAGMASLDVDGSGNPADPTALSELGITEHERRELAQLYTPGSSLWRVPIEHFTPWDLNWPMGVSDDARQNEETIPEPDDKEDDPDCENGSIIECQNQVLGKTLPITGSPFHLHYRSDRVPGRNSAYTLNIPVSGSSIPASLRRIELEITVAGRRFNQIIPALSDQTSSFTWDGLDAFGRAVQGNQDVRVLVGYVYPGIYYDPAAVASSFAIPGTRPISGNRQRGEATLWQDVTRVMGVKDARGFGLGAWSISPHHYFGHHNASIALGNGQRRSRQGLGPVITTVAGNSQWNWAGDGGPAVNAALMLPHGVAVAPDGTLFIADRNNNRIRKVDQNGVITTVAGDGGAYSWYGDGGPATEAVVDGPMAVAIGQNGEFFIAEHDGSRIRRVGADGIITTIAGTFTNGFSGDGGPATEAQIHWPSSLAVAPDGSIYFADSGNHRIRRIGPDGIITSIAGNGSRGFSGDGGPAIDASLDAPIGIALGDDGNLFISDLYNHRIRKVTPGGIITTYAGNGTPGFNGDGIPAIDASLSRPWGSGIGPDGSLYIADAGNRRVRRVWPNGIITTVAGNGDRWWNGSGDGGLATVGRFGSLEGLAIGADGSLYIADADDSRIRRVGPDASELGDGTFQYPSEHGNERYILDANGRHLRTENTITGAVRHQFEYDTNGYLIGIQDVNSEVLRIERETDGKPRAIVAADGQRTTLTLDANGYLATLTNPAGEIHRMNYTASGLLAEYADPGDNRSGYHYDLMGRLAKTENAAGGGWMLDRTILPRGYETSMTSAQGRTSRYRVEPLPMGDKLRTTSHPDGTIEITRHGTGGRRTVTTPDGTTTERVEGPDPRFGMNSPVPESETITTPAGRIFHATTERHAILADNRDLLSHTELSETVTRNGRVSTSRYTAADRTWWHTSPAGRHQATVLDDHGRVTQQALVGLTPLAYGYDARGRLEELVQAPNTPHERRSSLSYDEAGWLASITDPLSRTLSFDYDHAGRVIREGQPDGRETRYQYDRNGNLTALIPPGREAHLFSYTPVSLEEQYTPPAVSGALTVTHYRYNLDKQLTRIERPDGRALQLDYDPGGRLARMTLARGQYRYDYHPDTGRLSRSTDPDGGTLDYSWDGFLPLGERWSGGVTGTVSRSYADNFWLSSLGVNGDSVSFGYDDDGLLTRAGGLTITRNQQHGLPTDTLLGSITTRLDYNGFGESVRDRAGIGEATLLDISYSRDALGRIEAITAMVDGGPSTRAYSYDPAGRLVSASHDGVTTTWSYDSNGNRTHVNGTLVASYDEQDRLLTYGTASYSYTENGELKSKTEGGATTSYDYDELGNLLQATLPGDLVIDYLVDGRNRRIGKKVNGTLVQGLLYQDQLNPVAELDGSGNITSRFVYGDKPHVPAYMVRDGISYRILSDHLGSPRIIVNADTGAIAQRLDYDVWGNILLDTNPGFQPFGFAGGIYDLHTGLVRFGARDYDPATGRWTSKDPIKFDGDGPNLYGYVLGDPVTRIDPDGLRNRGTTQSIVRYYQRQMERKLEPVTREAPRREHSLADILPHPSDWYDLYKNIDFGENCVLICDGEKVMSCPASGKPYMKGCQIECRGNF